jgi:hypothetical protein
MPERSLLVVSLKRTKEEKKREEKRRGEETGREEKTR